MNSNIMLQLLRTVKPSNVKRYLLGKGWNEYTEFPRKDVWLFNHTISNEQIIVSREDNYELYPNDLLSVVNNLQHIKHRDAGLIITQLQRPDVDIVRYRIQSPQTESGVLPLNVINKFIVSVVNSFKAALSDCISPNLHHPRMGGTRLDLLMEQAQFGQTEHGSYAVKIIAPVLQDEQSPIFSAENDIRKGIVHLLKSTSEIVHVIEKENAEHFIENNHRQPSISDNFVNSLADMQLSDDVSLEIWQCSPKDSHKFLLILFEGVWFCQCVP